MMPRVVVPILAASLLAVLALGWGRGADPITIAMSRAEAQAGGSCPLTKAQQVKSVEAWKKLMPVFRHPRCFNCHGAMPKALPEPVRLERGWRGGATIRHAGVVDMDSTDGNQVCQECHVEGWRSALNAPNWADKTDRDICRGMHLGFEKNAPAFIDHILRDGGTTPFIDLAFAGKRGLIDGGQTIYETETGKKLIPAPPPGTHAQLTALARAWVAAQGGKFVGDKDCGCEIDEYGELYFWEVEFKDDRGVPGIRVTDGVTFKVRIVDTTVTISEITNVASKAVPEALAFPQSRVEWIPDPIGDVNVISATGEIAIDFPEPGNRRLLIHLTQSGTHAPAFVTILPRNVRQNSGGEANDGFPQAVTFTLLPGKTLYELPPAAGVQLSSKLTLLVKGKLPRAGRQ